MNLHVTFGGKAYDSTIEIIVRHCPQFGADRVLVLDDKWLIETGYVARNKWLYENVTDAHGTDYNHGFGWNSWKSFVIQTAMDRCENGDVVLYTDADTFPIAPYGALFDACRRECGVYLFEEPGCSTLRFTKADCFLAMGLPIEECPHACGRFSLWQKGSFLARQMLNEWWAYSVNPRCMRWDRSILQEDQPEYYRNSTEQSVLTNLAKKYGVPLHRSPDQCGADRASHTKDWDVYPQVFEQRYCTGDRGDVSGSAFRNM